MLRVRVPLFALNFNNMAQNMSYCAAENTRDCMEQLLNLIETGDKNDVFDEQPPHDYEARAIKDIAYLA
ncbi:hypothetical protein DRO61_08910, partial [Candidatus Bathyarchaeota archaeon]